MRNSRALSSPRSSAATRHHPTNSPRAGGRVARAAPHAAGGVVLNALIEVPNADRGDGQPGGAPLLLDELAELLPAHQIDELGVLAQFDPPSGASASQAVPLELIRSNCATGYLGVSHDARSTNMPYVARLRIGGPGKELHLGNFASAEDAATAYALAVRRACEPHGCAVALERQLAASQRKLELMERKLEVAQRYVPKGRRAAFLAEIAAADAADADADAADAAEIAAEPKPVRRKRGREASAPLSAAQKQQRLAAVAKGIVRGTDGAGGIEAKAPRVLTLSELKLDPLPAALTSHVLLQYVYAAGFTPLDLTGGKAKSELARHLVGFLESKQATEAQWSTAAGTLEPC